MPLSNSFRTHRVCSRAHTGWQALIRGMCLWGYKYGPTNKEVIANSEGPGAFPHPGVYHETLHFQRVVTEETELRPIHRTWTAVRDNLRWLFSHFCGEGISLPSTPSVLMQNKVNPFSWHGWAAAVTEPAAASRPAHRLQRGPPGRYRVHARFYWGSRYLLLRGHRGCSEIRLSRNWDSNPVTAPWTQVTPEAAAADGNSGALALPQEVRTPLSEGVDANVDYARPELRIKQ